MKSFEDMVAEGGAAAVEAACRFHMGDDRVHKTLRDFASELDKLGIPYAVVGGMALAAHGYVRATVDVDVLVTDQGLKCLHEALDGRGYLPVFAGSRNLRNTETSVSVEFLVSGQYPGDGKPKPVAFPDPAVEGELISGVRYLRLPALIEVKLASGMTSPGRLRDLADVQELIRHLHLPVEFMGRLNPFVRSKFEELWRGVNESAE